MRQAKTITDDKKNIDESISVTLSNIRVPESLYLTFSRTLCRRDMHPVSFLFPYLDLCIHSPKLRWTLNYIMSDKAAVRLLWPEEAMR